MSEVVIAEMKKVVKLDIQFRCGQVCLDKTNCLNGTLLEERNVGLHDLLGPQVPTDLKHSDDGHPLLVTEGAYGEAFESVDDDGPMGPMVVT